MEKKKFERPELEVIQFNNEDIIVTSSNGGMGGGSEPGDYDED